MVFLEARNIFKQYSEHLALNDVNISVPQGCVYGLLGPNGAGKTTLIRIINRITAPDRGEVLFDEHLFSASDVFRIGYLPEERGLYKKMKVEEQVLFLAQLRRLSRSEARRRIDYWFDKLNVNSWRNKKIEELSKGMQQKIQFITTVIHNPDLLILDEPFSGFDPINTELLKNEILELNKQGKTIILSTHNMESVEELCDEISLINNSKVVLDGCVDDIREQYKEHLFKLEIKGDSFLLDSEQLKVITQKNKEESVEVVIHKPKEFSNSEFLGRVVKQYEIISFEEKLPSMNEIFIKAVSEA